MTRPTYRHGRSKELSPIIAAVTLVLVGLRFDVGSGVSTGTVVGILLLPIWLPSAVRYWGIGRFLVVGAAGLVAGLLLTEAARVDHATSTFQLIGTSMLLVRLLVGVGVVLWARTLMSNAAVALWYAIGMLGWVAMRPQLFEVNPWKFALSIPLTIIALGLADKFGRQVGGLLVLLVLAGVSVVNDSRSFTAILLLSGALLLWALRPGDVRRGAGVLSMVTLVALTYAVYNIGSAAALEGYLGAEAQQRSVLQVQTSGSLILGGRPEMGATAGLIGDSWWGFGAGTQLTSNEILAAKTGMAELGYDPDNGYVERYMFGSGIELHSSAADLWAWFGVPGALLAIWIGWLLFRNLLLLIAFRQAHALHTFLVVNGFWMLLFGPFYTDSAALLLGLGLVATLRDHPGLQGRLRAPVRPHQRLMSRPGLHASTSRVTASRRLRPRAS